MARFIGILLGMAVALAAAADPPRAASAGDASDAALCERAIVVGARRGGVPAEVLHAIALTETGRNLGGRMRPWPWAINREGRGFWFATRDEALAFARASLAEGRRSFDVGCFQINHFWHGDAFESLDAMFDQETGGAYAASFLRALHQEFGGWSAAAGAYHSRTPVFAGIYRARFDRIFAGLGGAPLELAAEEDVAQTAAATTRRSSTRMAGGPKIVTLDAAGAGAGPEAAVAHIRVERGRLPPSLLAPSGSGRDPLGVSARDAPS